MPRRFRQTLKQSLFGDFIYAQIVPPDHFLVQLDRVIDWERFTPPLLAAYKGDAMFGAPPYAPVMILKMLLLSYLYNISERRTEELVTYTLPAKAFVGLGVADRAPDHSTLTLFKTRLLTHSGDKAYAELFDEIIRQAKAAGVQFGSIQVVDAVHTVANVNTDKDRTRHDQGKPSADPDARVVHKGTRRVTEADGTTHMHQIRYRGYKSHVSLDAETGLITSIEPTAGDVADNSQFRELVRHDQALGIPGDTYAADRAYDDGDLHEFLKDLGKHSALRLNTYRTENKNVNKEYWLRLLNTATYQAGCRVRYRIERKFGEGKAWHGFGRCRSRGQKRYAVQAFLTAMVLNLKRIVTLLTGVRLRPLAKKLQAG